MLTMIEVLCKSSAGKMEAEILKYYNIEMQKCRIADCCRGRIVLGQQQPSTWNLSCLAPSASSSVRVVVVGRVRVPGHYIAISKGESDTGTELQKL